MAAGLGFKTFTTGEVLTAGDVNGYLMQGINVFASSAARAAAITSPQEGQYSYLKDTNALEYYDGAAWVGAPVGDITAVNAGTGISGGGASGAVTITNSMATEITASGDIIVGTGSGTFDNLPIGTTGQVLTADTTVSPYKVKWATPTSTAFAGVSLEMTAQTLSNNTDTQLNWTSELYDTNGFHSTSSNTSRITIPTGLGGYYEFRWSLMFAANTSGNRRARLLYNGVGFEVGPVLTVGAPNGGLCGLVNSTVVNTVAGDYWELQVFQDSGGSLNTGGTGNLFQANKVG